VQPLWKLNSGHFFGWRREDDLFDASGHHIGYFAADIAYSLTGEYIGEIRESDFIARPVNRIHAGAGGRSSRGQIRVVPRPDRHPRPSKAWEDPEV